MRVCSAMKRTQKQDRCKSAVHLAVWRRRLRGEGAEGGGGGGTAVEAPTVEGSSRQVTIELRRDG